MRESPAEEEKAAFTAYLTGHGLKRSGQRDIIVEAFFRSDRHLSVEDLYRIVQRKRRDIGRTTIYRTLKLLHAAGLASELVVGGHTRFERDFKRDHHDHLICNSCAEIFEFTSPEMEAYVEQVAGRMGFRVDGHLHHIFGVCRRCASRSQGSADRG